MIKPGTFLYFWDNKTIHFWGNWQDRELLPIGKDSKQGLGLVSKIVKVVQGLFRWAFLIWILSTVREGVCQPSGVTRAPITWETRLSPAFRGKERSGFSSCTGCFLSNFNSKSSICQYAYFGRPVLGPDSKYNPHFIDEKMDHLWSHRETHLQDQPWKLPDCPGSPRGQFLLEALPCSGPAASCLARRQKHAIPPRMKITTKELHLENIFIVRISRPSPYKT